MLEAAAALFWTRGYARTTTRELSAGIGIQSASLYYHIGAKEDLLYKICLDSLERIFSVVSQAVGAETDPLERLRVMIRTHVTTALADRNKHATMLVELRSLSDVRQAEVKALRRRYDRFVREVLAEASAAGVLRNDIQPKYLSLALLNLLNWSIFWFDPAGELSAEGLSEILASVFLSGAMDNPGMPA